jgi:hypothetical protein
MSLGPDKNSKNPLMVRQFPWGMCTLTLTFTDPILHVGLRPSRNELVEAFRKRGLTACGTWHYPGLVTAAQQSNQ